MRELDAGFEAAIADDVVRPVLALEMELASTTVRYCTAGRDISFNGETFSGNGFIHGVGDFDGFDAFDSESVDLAFTGHVSALRTLVQTSFRRNKLATIYLILMEADSTIAGSDVLFIGTYQESQIEIGPDGASLTVSYEDRFALAEEDVELRYTNEYQQSRFSGDLQCEYIAQLSDINFYFGRPEKGKKGKKGDDRGKSGKPRNDIREKKKKRKKRKGKKK